MKEMITPMYLGKRENFHWIGFGSGSGTNLRECSHVIPPALIFSDRPKAKLLQLEEFSSSPIEKIVIDGYAYCGSRKKAMDDSMNNPAAMSDYESKCIQYNGLILSKIEEFEEKQGYDIDLIVLGGYMRLVTEPLLSAFKDKIINVHPADLSILIDEHQRKYVGDNAVYDAILGGESYTLSSVIIVDGDIDHGEILTQGKKLVVPDYITAHVQNANRRNVNFLKYYSERYQDNQKKDSDWPSLTAALDLIADGRIALGSNKNFHNEWRTVYLDGNPLPYSGVDIDLNFNNK